MAAYLRVLGYDALSLTFGANGMIYDEMAAIGHRWSDAAIMDYPNLTTGGETPQDILEARVEAIFAEGFGAAAVSSGTVYGALSNYYIVNYWPNDHYEGMGHIDGSIQYTPKVDLHSDEFLNTLPTNKSVVVYCYSGQHSANMAAYLRVLGYDALSLTFGANGMIHDEMTAGKWSDDFIFDYPLVVTPPAK
jgi:rhodanese-related sulfurtransferase